MPTPTRAAVAASLAAGTTWLLVAAIWNRFPFTFWDTRAYLVHSITLAPRVDRLIGYSLVIRLLTWTGTLWSVVVVQSAMVVWLLWLVAVLVLRRPDPLRFVIVIAGLCGITALPWIAGQLMPDIFTPVLVLALFGLVLHRGRLGTGTQIVLATILAVAAAVHVTHAVFGVALAAVMTLAGLGSSLRRRGRLIGPAIATGALLFGLVGMLAFNYARTHQARLVAGGDAFLLAHLVESGLASELLDAHCGQRDYLLCPYRASLPMSTDEFLWQNRLPFHPFEQIAATSRETHRLLLDSWREHPGSQLRIGLEYSAGALSRFGTGEGLDSLALPGLDSAVSLVAPGDRSALASARQQHGAIPLNRWRSIHTPVGWGCLLGALAIVILAWLRGRPWRRDRAVGFLATALLSVVIYAVLCGNTSGIYDRYESRLVWLTGFGLWLAAEQYRRARLSRRRTRQCFNMPAGRVSATR